MERLLSHARVALSLILCTLCLVGCKNSVPTPEEPAKTHTVIVYMGAENSLASYAQWDLEEMKSALDDIPQDCQVVVYHDATAKPIVYRLTKDKFAVWREYREELNSADAEVMKSVLRDIVSGLKSNSYSLVLWSHGTGWSDYSDTPQRSIIIDNGRNNGWSNTGTWLNVSQLASVLETLPRMQYIFFDACFMQSVEVASHLYPLTDHIIAAPNEIPGLGAPYHLMMKELCQANIKGIIDRYAEGYPGSHGVLLSAVCTAEFPNLCSLTAQFVPQAFARENMPSTDGIQIYAPRDLSSQPVPYDMRSAMHRALSAEQFALWETQWQKTILHCVKSQNWDTSYRGAEHDHLTDPDHYGGISMHIPQEVDEAAWNAQFQATPWYNMAGWEQTGW